MLCEFNNCKYCNTGHELNSAVLNVYGIEHQTNMAALYCILLTFELQSISILLCYSVVAQFLKNF
jgi:hypothetical protein